MTYDPGPVKSWIPGAMFIGQLNATQQWWICKELLSKVTKSDFPKHRASIEKRKLRDIICDNGRQKVFVLFLKKAKGGTIGKKATCRL